MAKPIMDGTYHILPVLYFEDLEEEIHSAIIKHGIHQTPLSDRMGEGEKFVILVEEIGEVARAMTYDEGDDEELREELLQVAAMAYAWYLSMVKET